MEEHEPHDHVPSETETAQWARQMTKTLFPWVVFILWVILAGLISAGYLDVKNLRERVAVLESQRDELHDAIKEMQADIKELLREVRK